MLIIQVTYKIMQAEIMPGSKLTENVKSHPNQFQPHKIFAIWALQMVTQSTLRRFHRTMPLECVTHFI